MLLTAAQDQMIKDRLAEELAELENRFAAELHSDLPCVNTLVQHVERYRGKMLRPMLVFVAGMASSPTRQDLTDAHRVVATVVEMVHMATLVHDDILDEADVRRRGATVSYLRGNETAVMLGDYLISHAYHLCSSLPSPASSRLIAQATNTVCEGELLQLSNRENWSLSEATYFEIIRRKTASLCGTSCRLGGLLSGASETVCHRLDSYGERVGTAFQIVDDVLDLTGDQATVGKTLGLDLEKGKMTLPMIHALATAEPALREQLLQLLAGSGPRQSDVSSHGNDARPPADSRRLDPGTVEQIRQLIVDSGSVEYANDCAARLIEQARQDVEVLPESAARRFLQQMADAVLTRKF